MTRNANARLAGFAYLFYIAVAFPDMVLMRRATRGDDVPAQLTTLAQHASVVHVSVVLTLLSALSALVLAVTLHAITRDEDADLAMLGLSCRVAEGITGVVGIPSTLGLLWLATASGPSAPDPAALRALGTFLLQRSPLVPATLFAFGSTIFCWLLLRGRMIPTWLAWVGFLGSALIAVGLPLQLADVLHGLATQIMYVPVAVFEITVAVWFLTKGVDTAAHRSQIPANL
jgi:hypothetical protein